MDIVIRKQSEQIQRKNHDKSNLIFYDKKWEWGFLRKQCRNLELEQFYVSYMHKLQRSYLSIFIAIQAVFGISHVIMLLAAVDNYEYIYVDIISYISSIILVWIALFICFREDIMRTRPNVVYAASFIVVFVLVFTDLLVPIYDAAYYKQTLYLRPSCGSYILYAVYIFIPLNENWHAFILGMAVTICYLINFAMVTYKNDAHIVLRTFTEAIFLLCINMLGFYFRMMKEIYIRTTFIDRRECVEENLMLKYARDQEKSLLLSIIPAQTADKIEREVRERIEKIKMENITRMSLNHHHHHGATVDPAPIIRRWRKPDSMKLFIEPHNDVSVLYADVVNYTYLTTQLDVQTLVETIHDLFVKFDQASEAHNVLRIKFLGDCYYCVSGVPIKNSHHAKSCVDLGLRMIKDIREVRKRRNLDIDMRIGVHSGDIFSGVIGACKWQYDIWSKDVDIANRLETTGVAGKVHISQQTLDLLNDEYDYSEGTQKAKDDEVLNKHGIKSYLITPPRSYLNDHSYRHSIGARRLIENMRPSKIDSSMNFMQNTIEQYNQIRIQAKLEMSRELDKMPIGKFHISNICIGDRTRLTEDEMEERNFRNNVSTFLLMFKDYRWEYLYLREPDVLLKYSIIIAFIVFIGIILIQGINQPANKIFWIVNTIDGIILLIFVVIAWYKKLWIMINPAPAINLDDEQDESGNDRKPKNKVSRYLYDLSDVVMRSILARGFIYLMTVITLCLTSLLQLTACPPDGRDEVRGSQLCINPWAITESLIMTICMSFLFSRIPFLFKLFIGLIIVFLYGYFVMNKYEYVFNESVSTNRNLKAEYSHMMVVILTFAIFHLIDRQSEYISKVDYTWKRQLQKKQEDAEFTNETIKILIHNILPAHVADIYMMKKMKDEHYFEEYDNVAVMFATIKNYDSEKTGLDVLNGIICDFDEKLMNYKGPLTIEKIKIAGWSYMAACGLDETKCSSTTSFNGNRASSRSSGLLPTGRRLNSNALGSRSKRMSCDSTGVLPNKTMLNHKSDKKQGTKAAENVVFVMTEFALELMKSLQAFNRENFQQEDDTLNDYQFQLRIGISHGKVMAGVVGSSKPLYDIWGNAVNMASRMDSTGIPGYIQVTQETAEILQSFSIKCEYRGLTFVKGCDHIPTYFVGINDDLSFIRKSLTGPNHTYENLNATKIVRNSSTMF